jgi:hypothetical protein
VITTQILAFSDHLLQLSLDDYNESALVEHIHACQTIYFTISHTYIDLINRQLLFDENLLIQTNLKNQNSIISSSCYYISNHVLDSLETSCDISCRKAIYKALNDLETGRKHLVKGILCENLPTSPFSSSSSGFSEKDGERGGGWMNGNLCSVFVTNLQEWFQYIQLLLPEKYQHIIHNELFIIVIKMYMKNLLEVYRSSKSNFLLSLSGIHQLKNDCNEILNWINEKEGITAGGLGNAEIEKQFLEVAQTFLVCNENNALKFFADTIVIFGLKYQYHCYDLLRLFLKIRIDILPRLRKTILGICNEFLIQLEKAIISDPKLIDGKFHGKNCRLLDELFPFAGIEHCTGLKWKMETSSDPTTVRLMVSLMITDVCNQAVIAKRQRLAAVLSGQATPVKDIKNEDADDSKTKSPSINSVRYTSPLSIRKFAIENTNTSGNNSVNNSRDVTLRQIEPIRQTSDDIVAVDASPSLSSLSSCGSDGVNRPPLPPRPVKPPPPPARRRVSATDASDDKSESSSHLWKQPNSGKTVSSNPFDEQTREESKENGFVPPSLDIISSEQLLMVDPAEITLRSHPPPPKPVRRNTHTAATSPSISQPDSIRCTSSEEGSSMRSARSTALSPQEALNLLLVSAQKGLSEK